MVNCIMHLAGYVVDYEGTEIWVNASDLNPLYMVLLIWMNTSVGPSCLAPYRIIDSI